jgi:hypothetical protein
MTNRELMGGGASPAELARNMTVVENALKWASPAPYRLTLGLFEFQFAMTFPALGPDRTLWLKRAEQHVISELMISPADGYGWVMLALMRQILIDSPRNVVDPLITSLDVAPNRRELWTPRMSLLMMYWAFLRPNELPIVRHQIRTMWDVPRFQFFLYDTALRYRRKQELLDALAGDAEALEEIRTFDRNMAYP